MEMLSKTESKYEGLKYNLYLRAAFMYLMCFVRPTIQMIYSQSTNPISTYAMYKHYHATNEDLEKYVTLHELSPDTFTIDHANKFHDFFAENHRPTLESVQEELDNELEECSESLGVECTVEDLGYGSIEEALEAFRSRVDYKPAPQLEVKLGSDEVKDFLLQKMLNTDIKCLGFNPENNQKISLNKTIGGNKSIRRRKTYQRHKTTRSRKHNTRRKK
jgi:hypothetical protein